MASTLTDSLRAHIATCPHPGCAATRRLEAGGARLIPGKGRHCELAALAAADGDITDAELVAARRDYARHLGVALGVTTGVLADAKHAVHAKHVAEGNIVGNKDASAPIRLGRARITRQASPRGESYDVYRLIW